MEKRKHIFWESVLIVASVFVFRGLWNFMDKVPFFNETKFLLFSFIAGMFFMGVSYYYIVHAEKRHA